MIFVDSAHEGALGQHLAVDMKVYSGSSREPQAHSNDKDKLTTGIAIGDKEFL